MIKNLTIISFLCLFYSCASKRSLDVDIDIPIGQYGMSPETIDALIYGAASFIGPLATNDVELARTSQDQDVFSNTPGEVDIDTKARIEGSASIGLTAQLGFFRYFEVIGSKVGQYVSEAGIKVCPLMNCFSQEPGFKMAVYGLYGRNTDEETTKDIFLTQADTNFDNVNASVTQRTTTAGLILGLRLNQSMLYTLNFSHTTNKIESSINIDGGASFSNDSRAESSSVLAGIRINSQKSNNTQYFIQFETGYNLLKIRGESKIKRDSLGAGLNLGLYLF